MYMLLLLIITLTTTLHSMENTVKDTVYWNKELILKPHVYLKNQQYQSENINTVYSKFIDLAERERAGHLRGDLQRSSVIEGAGGNLRVHRQVFDELA